VLTRAEMLNQIFRRPKRKSQDADGCGFVGAVQKYAGVANVKIRHVVSLADSDFYAAIIKDQVVNTH
jgi:hypothetical protein